MNHDAPEHEIIQVIIDKNRWRNFYLNEERSCTLRLKSICRRLSNGDKIAAATLYESLLDGTASEDDIKWSETLIKLRAELTKRKKELEKPLIALAKILPIWEEFGAHVPGFGALGLAQIVAEAGGPLTRYATPARLWKRMGLGIVYSKRQQKVKDKEEAKDMGYNPRRRSVIYVIGAALIKTQGPYRDLYLARLRTEHEKALSEGLVPISSVQATLTSWKNRGLPKLEKITQKQFDPKLHRSAGHLAKRAQRYMEKRLLRDLWRAWNHDTSDPCGLEHKEAA